MTDNGNPLWNGSNERRGPRIHSVREITISYEGEDESVIIKPPNVSAKGMFINTSRVFPEGAVLNVRFALALTSAEIQTRCEVRYCQPGVGVGVEFIGLPPEAEKRIEKEIALSSGQAPKKSAKARAPRPLRRTRRKGRR